jgi:hypothetical protein
VWGFGRRPKPAPAEPAAPGATRIALCERCEFEVGSNGVPREGIAWNLSVVGLYLVVQGEIPTMGAPVRVTLWLPGDPNPLHAATEVMWVNPPSLFKGCGAKALRFPPGCGLRFVDIPEADLARIRARVETVQPIKAERDPQR